MTEANQAAKRPQGLTKMSIKTMGCVPKKAAVDKVKIALANIYGRVVKVMHSTDAAGDAYSALIGVFEGVNLQTGEVYQAAKLFLPSGIQEILESPFNSDEPPKTLDFGFTIFAFPAENPQGYSYSFETIAEPNEADELATIRSQVKQKLALPAPTAGTEEKTAKKK